MLTVEASVALVLDAQTPAGAIPASTVHEVYRFGWLRDGSWCAYALDRAGQAAAASAWHEWVARTLLDHEHRVDEALAAIRSGHVDYRVMMPARFTLDGREEPVDPDDEWPNFQTDCYGFWLWAAADHVRRGGRMTGTLRAGIRLAIRYVVGAADTPCFDCWEEHPGHLHTATLGVNAAGLRDAGALLVDATALARAAELTARITGPEFSSAGSLVRFPGDLRVDGALLWLAVPFGIVALDEPLFESTLRRIREELRRPGGGVQRYLGDTFFGGSEWILLAASLGWVAAESGDRALATGLLSWIESTADDDGFLPEQVDEVVQSPYMLEHWRGRWGAAAKPLLWSHAMYIVLQLELAAA